MSKKRWLGVCWPLSLRANQGGELRSEFDFGSRPACFSKTSALKDQCWVDVDRVICPRVVSPLHAADLFTY